MSTMLIRFTFRDSSRTHTHTHKK